MHPVSIGFEIHIVRTLYFVKQEPGEGDHGDTDLKKYDYYFKISNNLIYQQQPDRNCIHPCLFLSGQP
jgi:hypothetical protein